MAMARTVRWLGVSAVGLLLVGCLKRPGAGDAGSDAGAPSASAAVEAAAPDPNTAANAADVTHYPAQTTDNLEPLTAHYMANARTEASAYGGKVVAELKAGTQAKRMADHEGYDLALFADPSDATRQIEGWVPQGVFGTVAHVVPKEPVAPVAVADAGPKPAPVATGFVCVKQAPPGTCRAGFAVSGAVCRVACTSPADCHGPDPKCNQGRCFASNGCGD